jgi:hypothetical protein
LALVLIVDDAEVLRIISTVFGCSEPGAQVHQLVLVRETRHPVLGTPQPVIGLHGILPTFDNAIANEQFVVTAIANALDENPNPVLAVFTMEMFGIAGPVLDEVAENRARVLHAEGHLGRHEDAIEFTWLYAAHADGRRWTGEHHLTGAEAGTVEGPTCLPRGERAQSDGRPVARQIRAGVGLLW